MISALCHLCLSASLAPGSLSNFFSVPSVPPSVTSALRSCIFLHFFAPARHTTPFPSIASALFCKNTRGVGSLSSRLLRFYLRFRLVASKSFRIILFADPRPLNPLFAHLSGKYWGRGGQNAKPLPLLRALNWRWAKRTISPSDQGVCCES